MQRLQSCRSVQCVFCRRQFLQKLLANIYLVKNSFCKTLKTNVGLQTNKKNFLRIHNKTRNLSTKRIIRICSPVPVPVDRSLRSRLRGATTLNGECLRGVTKAIITIYLGGAFASSHFCGVFCQESTFHRGIFWGDGVQAYFHMSSSIVKRIQNSDGGNDRRVFSESGWLGAHVQ